MCSGAASFDAYAVLQKQTGDRLSKTLLDKLGTELLRQNTISEVRNGVARFVLDRHPSLARGRAARCRVRRLRPAERTENSAHRESRISGLRIGSVTRMSGMKFPW